MSDRRDSERWICWRCSDIDYLDENGLCATCAPELVVEWWQVMVRAVTGGGEGTAGEMEDRLDG